MKNKLTNIILKHVFDHSGLSQKDFSKSCLRKQPNVASYLNGSKPLAPKTLGTCLENYYGWPVEPLREIEPFGGDFSDIPEVPGLYIFYNSEGKIIYFGKAANLKTRAKASYDSKSLFRIKLGPKINKKKEFKKGHFVKYISLYKIENKKIRHNFEAFLLHVFPNQSHNSNSGYFK